MSRKLFPTDVIEQAQSVASAWNQIGTAVTLGTLTSAQFTADLTSAATLDAQLASLEHQLTNVRNQREALYGSIWDKVKRVRAGVKANYGDDSSQYELVGCTRISDRKPRSRKSLPVAE